MESNPQPPEEPRKRGWFQFTFTELVIAIAVVLGLMYWSMPRYVHYADRARASEALRELGIYKSAVEACAKQRRTLAGCSLGSIAIPAAKQKDGTERLQEGVTVRDGVISARFRSSTGASPVSSVILTPSLNPEFSVAWKISGEICEPKFEAGCDR